MWSFKRKSGRGGAALADPPADPAPRTLPELQAEIERLTAAPRTPATARRLLRLRHLAGVELLGADDGAGFPEPDVTRLPDAAGGLPELTRGEVDAATLRGGILRDGCVLVRGLFDRDAALAFADQIDRAFADRDAAAAAGGVPRHGRYEELAPEPPYEIIVRPWIAQGGGVLGVDAPEAFAGMLDLFDSAGVPELMREYLGGPPLLSAHKTTLRRADPSVGGGWHQDGKFMGEVRALNLWVALSRCGDVAPGLDIVPRRLDDVVRDLGAEAVLDYVLTDERAHQVAAEAGTSVVRPVFEPGDALFFDELFLHKTGSDPSMPNPRFAIESWFFGATGFPDDYAPVAV